jgi:DNA-binding MarR family transcriptional regulator
MFTILDMEAIKSIPGDKLALWQQAQNSLVRYILGVSRYLQSGMMERLTVECGHKQLRLGFAPYVTLIGERDFRPTELAEQLGITRQACNQVIRQLEAAGYVGHLPDPQDGRAKLLTLSRDGQRLRRDGIRIVRGFDTTFASFTSNKNAVEAAQALRSIAAEGASAPAIPGAGDQDIDGLAGLLPRISDFIIHRLMELTRAKGHPGLKLSFGQVIPLIGAEGGRIQQIAALQDVSKQAISVIAMELEGLGYLTRETDSDDARQIVLRFTGQGIQLMTDAAQSVSELELELAEIAGKKQLKNLSLVFEEIFKGLGLAKGRFDKRESVDLNLLAKQLRQQLGARGSDTLAQLLLKSH